MALRGKSRLLGVLLFLHTHTKKKFGVKSGRRGGEGWPTPLFLGAPQWLSPTLIVVKIGVRVSDVYFLMKICKHGIYCIIN